MERGERLIRLFIGLDYRENACAGFADMKTSVPSRTAFMPLGAGWMKVVLLTAALSCPAFAVLGSVSDSVQADQEQMNASLKITQADAYAVHEMKASTGIVVREYVSRADGRVFGIAWQGPFMPSMQRLLGTYFEHYSQAAKAQRKSRVGRRPLDIQEPGLVVQSAGHMLAFSGRAYDPGLLPTGVTAIDIQ
jgi:hypothetical protein